MTIVINTCFGGFGLSPLVVKRLAELHGEPYLASRPDDRADPLLIQVIEELGDAANGSCAHLKIIEIPDGTDYTIEEYDGVEHVAEKCKTWR